MNKSLLSGLRVRLALVSAMIAPVTLAIVAPATNAQTPPPPTDATIEEAVEEAIPPAVPPEAAPEADTAVPEPAQEANEEAVPEQTFTTVCTFDPNGGVANPLGMRAFVTVSEVEGNSVFLYEQFPSFVTAEGDTGRQADVASTRTLTLYNTPINEARQLVVDNAEYYGALMDISPDEVTAEDGFGPINDTLVCQEVSDPNIANVPQPPANPAPMPAQPPAAPEGETTTTYADLPDGNYRLVSADFSNRIVTDEELLEAGGAMFLFRKNGENVTGAFSFIDHEGGSCITGTIEGNTVTGDSFTYSDQVRSGTFLTLGEDIGNNRYSGSALNLESFSRINAGTRLPVESCP
ncbi:MAG: hypothetical protein AAGC93_25640 [Cyanobacteria bacterium P01_F01_bin.53]